MDRLVQALLTLALMAPVLAAPGPVYTTFQQQPISRPSDLHRNAIVASRDSMDAEVPLNPGNDISMSRTSHSNIQCTPGDRQCHASLKEILFCNDNHRLVSYSQCQTSTFCHRLFIVCVPENLPHDQVTPAATELFPHNNDHITANGPRTMRDNKPHQCKEGDRRCSQFFNRVDRCNKNHEWVTYHDCHLSELCYEILGECLPRDEIPFTLLPPLPLPTPL